MAAALGGRCTPPAPQGRAALTSQAVGRPLLMPLAIPDASVDLLGGLGIGRLHPLQPPAAPMHCSPAGPGQGRLAPCLVPLRRRSRLTHRDLMQVFPAMVLGHHLHRGGEEGVRLLPDPARARRLVIRWHVVPAPHLDEPGGREQVAAAPFGFPPRPGPPGPLRPRCRKLTLLSRPPEGKNKVDVLPPILTVFHAPLLVSDRPSFDGVVHSCRT